MPGRDFAAAPAVTGGVASSSREDIRGGKMNLERRLAVLGSCILASACSLPQRPSALAPPAGAPASSMSASPTSSPAPLLVKGISCAKHEAPPFPQEAVLAKVAEGHVRAVMTIDGRGTVAEVRIVSSDPPGLFDGAVRDTLRKWQCAATAAKYQASVQINFALKGGAADGIHQAGDGALRWAEFRRAARPRGCRSGASNRGSGREVRGRAGRDVRAGRRAHGARP